jgi:hypothetical protein
MDYDAFRIIQGELDSGERLIWSGNPRQEIFFQSSDIFMIPFSLLWGGFAIFWEIMALSITSHNESNVDLIFPLFGIPFVIIGLYMIFGRFIYESKKRAKTYYGLTDQRVIIVSGVFSKNIKSLNLRTMTDISLSEKSNKSGTITFGQENALLSFFNANSFPGMGGGSNVPKFEFIENAKDVYNQIRDLQKKS